MKLLSKFKLGQLPILFWGYVLVILAIVTPWFLKPGYLFMTDNVWAPNIKLNWTSSGFLLKFLLRGLSFIFSVDFLEKMFITSTLVLILLGGLILIKTILDYNKSKTYSSGLVFILSLFALFNPFVYDRALYGQFGILIAYGWSFFVLSYLFKFLQTLEFKNLYLVAVFSTLVSMFCPQFIFFLAPFYLLFLISLFLKRQEIKSTKGSKNFWRAFLFSILIVLIFNANLLVVLFTKTSSLSTFVEKGITTQDLAAFPTAGNTPTETFTNVLMMSGFWGKDQFRYLDLTDVSGWQRSFILLLPIIFYGIYLSFRNRSRQNKIFSFSLIIIFVLAVILAVGIKAPIARGLTLFLYDHLPFYKGLREPQKWVAVIIPIYLFYLTLGSSYLIKAKMIINNKILSGIILTIVIIMLAPSLLWGFNRQVESTQYPNDWYEVNNMLLSKSSEVKNCSDGVLFLPWHMYMSFNWVGKIIANPAPKFFSCPVISGTNMEWGGIYDNSKDFNGTAVADWLRLKGDGGMPTLVGTSIHYVILAKELDFKGYLWLNDISYLQLIKETKTLLVYEVR